MCTPMDKRKVKYVMNKLTFHSHIWATIFLSLFKPLVVGRVHMSA